MEELFRRSEHNPLITEKDLPYQANAVFNAGVADLEDEVLLLLRVESPSGRSHLIVARSEDGVGGWCIEDRALVHAEHGCPYEVLGAEDCRITWVPEMEEWVLAYTAYTAGGPGVALASTEDFEQVRRLGLVHPPENKNAALFPRRFKGLFAMLHRPCTPGGVWLSYSPDLVFWGKPQLVLPPRPGPWWDGMRVGAGLPPIETEEGWLIIYHGVKEVANNPLYRLGAALLDLEEPHRLIARARRWLLSPQEPYERTGDAGNVVFACGGVVRDGELWMYYGAADSCICLARAPIEDILELVRAEPVKPL